MSIGKPTTPASAASHRQESAVADATAALDVPAAFKAAGRSSLLIDNPHELLGLVAGEENIRVIIEAARSRLIRIREANGSEVAVRAYVIGQICRARAAMLKDARRASAGRDREGGQRSPGKAVDSTMAMVHTRVVG